MEGIRLHFYPSSMPAAAPCCQFDENKYTPEHLRTQPDGCHSRAHHAPEYCKLRHAKCGLTYCEMHWFPHIALGCAVCAQAHFKELCRWLQLLGEQEFAAQLQPGS